MNNATKKEVHAEEASPRRHDTSRAWINGRTIGLFIAAAMLFGVLALHSPSFVKPYTMFIISRQMAFFVLIALAQAVCLAVGGMNLSVGAIGSIATVTLGLCFDTWGLPVWLSVPAALGIGCFAGFVNGQLITRLKLDSFVVTLSIMFVLMGLRSGISGGAPYQVPKSFWVIGQGKILGIPYVVLITLAVLAGVAYMYRNTLLGRGMLATGGNEKAARLSGINTNSMIVWANVLSGLFAALAAILWASKLGSAAPETGDSWLIISFAVAIIGGTGLTGGSISALGVLMGGTIYMLINHGLVDLKVNPYYANSFLGGLILLAVVVDRIRETYSDRRRPAKE
jgi:ribose transport system permease protein